jgi:hypothetical protein
VRVLALALAVLLLGCTASRANEVQPREGRSGLQGTGTIEGRQVVVGQGLPELLVGDCDPVDEPDADVCIISDTVDGRSFVLNVENPDALAEGVELPVTDPGCPSPSACDEVTGSAVVSVKLETDHAVRATGGSLRMTRIVPFTNYVGEVLLELPGGRFSGSFDVVPRPE